MSAPVVPGRVGLPLAGRTLGFLKDPFGFISTGMAEHGGVFKAGLLGRTTVFIAGPEACALWLDEERITRDAAFPSNIRALFGGESLPMLDGEAHRSRKRLLFAGFDRPALESYVPILSDVIEQRLAAWRAAGELAVLEELKSLSMEGICRTLFGVEPGPALDAFVADYGDVLGALAAVPVNLPGFAYRSGLAAVGRLLERYADLIADHRATPRDDGLGRILRAMADAPDVLDDAALALELHHFILAGNIVFAELASMLDSLAGDAALRAALRAEVVARRPEGSLSLEDLAALPLLGRVVMEVKRTCDNVPVAFGRARRTFEFAGYTIQEGWGVFLCPGENNRSAAFSDPDRFDPDRFADGRAEHAAHPHAFAPQGCGELLEGHKCLGIDFSTWFMAAFGAVVVRGADWSLPEQDRSMRRDQVPPTPVSGLVVAFVDP